MRTPVVTMALSGAVVALFLLAGQPDALLLHPSSGASEPWRWLTAHLVHLSFNHLLWDVLAFAVLGSAIELQSRRRLLGVLASSAVGISGFLVLAHPELSAYAGLSGIDAALTTAVAVQLWRAGSTDRTLGTVLGVAFIGKLVAEQLSGGPLFAGDTAQHAASVHAVGALIGGAVAAVTSLATPTPVPATLRAPQTRDPVASAETSGAGGADLAHANVRRPVASGGTSHAGGPSPRANSGDRSTRYNS